MEGGSGRGAGQVVSGFNQRLARFQESFHLGPSLPQALSPAVPRMRAREQSRHFRGPGAYFLSLPLSFSSSVKRKLE